MTSFSEFNLAAPVARALAEAGYDTPTPIQVQAIPPALEGRDLMGIAQTGTGKTLAFAAPTLDRLCREQGAAPACGCRVLVLAPTRELAGQIAESFATYGQFMGLRIVTAFGGVKISRQITQLKRGAHILVATPGRLEDLMAQGALSLRHVQVLVLDEADQMLDVGFIHALRRIAKAVPPARQTLFFSATMADPIARLAADFLTDPVRVAVTPQATTAERVRQTAYFIKDSDKPAVLAGLLRSPDMARALVFTRTKHGADRLVRQLDQAGLAAAAIHGNKSQPQRTRALEAFKAGRCPVLVATDIAARGIDVDGLSHVINYELPNVPEQYVHRIGRTGRAGAEGIAISLVAGDEKGYLRDIEKTMRRALEVLPAPEGFSDDHTDVAPAKPQGRGGGRRGGRGQPGGAAAKQRPATGKREGGKSRRRGARKPRAMANA